MSEDAQLQQVTELLGQIAYSTTLIATVLLVFAIVKIMEKVVGEPHDDFKH